ncbi:protein translocase subunit SecF [Candidatus Daviesbacteria bacterium]|nr:protein translocase subunit SecF [Candidatus Daviesbacteria bacterium]
MRYKYVFFIISTLVILPGLYFLITSGLKLGIDFTGGSLLEYHFEKEINIDELKKYGQVVKSGDKTYILRTKPQEFQELQKLKSELAKLFGKFDVRREENVGPIIGQELKQKAILATIVACVAILIYISISFRKVPKPTSSFRFALSTIVALIHDVLLIVGVFAILGKFYNIEIDTLFVSALLTIIGFSVHDSIVVLDRVRENLTKFSGKKFSEIADISITQTLARSLNTSLTVVFVLVALLLFGGETIRYFTIALLVGVISGTYSSIFNALAFLTWWEEKLGH